MISAKEYAPVVNGLTVDPRKLMKGTSAYHRFWEEQYQRCMNGYQPTGGTWMSGNYYFYLNFCQIRAFDKKINKKRPMPPSYRDLDHEYFTKIHECEQKGSGVIVLKARRKGFSFMNANLLLHEWTFFEGSETGMGAQKEHYVSDFYKKLLLTYNHIHPAFRNKYLLQNSKLFTSGWKEKEDGIWIEKGMGSLLYFRLIERPDEFRGTTLAKWVVDEAGEVPNLKQVYFANEECFREGAHQFGVPIIGGTSNKMSHDSEDFMQMWYNHDKYNLEQFFVSAAKVYYPFFNDDTGESDIEPATKDIKKRLSEKKGDKAAWYTFKQEMPLSPEDAFVVHGSTPFDLEKINTRITELNTNKDLRIWKTGRLEWPTDKKGKKVFGGKPVFVFDDLGPMKMVEGPLPEMKGANVAAADPYHVADDLEEKDQKVGDKNRSNGCMYVYRRFINMNTPGEMPVLEYFDRPYSKEEFYENCLKICLYFDCQVLIEYNDDGFLKYFINKKFSRYLMQRPKSADAPYSQASNRYGIHMKTYQKNLVVELIDEYVKKNIDNIYLLGLLKEMAVFGAKNTDRVMAFGMSLIADMDTLHRVKKKEDDEEVGLGLPQYEMKDGILTVKSNKAEEDPIFDDGFSKLRNIFKD